MNSRNRNRIVRAVPAAQAPPAPAPPLEGQSRSSTPGFKTELMREQTTDIGASPKKSFGTQR